MAHASRSIARRYRRLRRKYGDAWDQEKWEANHPAPTRPDPILLLRKGEERLIARSTDNMRRDLFTYESGWEVSGLTALALAQGYRFP